MSIPLETIPLTDPELLRTEAFVAGSWVASEDTFDVVNPATGGLLATVPDLGAEHTRQAIEVAAAAWPEWRARTAKERGEVLLRWRDLILEATEDLAMIMTAEQGKPMAEARGEVAYGASFIEWFAEEGRRTYGKTIPTHSADKRILVLPEPVGVTAAITPWNFPNAMITRKAAPALAAGCPMVIKPAEDTPLSALALAVLGERAGIPSGLISVVTASRSNAAEVGAEMTSNPTVRKVSFTGSTAVGKVLMRQSAETVKKVSLELGGNAAFIVFDDADLDAAIDGLIASKFRNTGQTCICANRILVHAPVYDEFAARLADRVSQFAVGAGLEIDADQGPLINEAAVEKVERHLADAESRGATVIMGGARHRLGGTFFQPTIVTGVTADMLVASEETFGPVAPLFRFETEEEAIRLANATEFGLASYLYAQDVGRVWRVAEALESGMVGVNTGAISTEVAPFGGVKESGIGREGAHDGIEEYLEQKYVCLGGL